MAGSAGSPSSPAPTFNAAPCSTVTGPPKVEPRGPRSIEPWISFRVALEFVVRLGATDEFMPCTIVSAEDGVITTLSVLWGTPVGLQLLATSQSPPSGPTHVIVVSKVRSSSPSTQGISTRDHRHFDPRRLLPAIGASFRRRLPCVPAAPCPLSAPSPGHSSWLPRCSLTKLHAGFGAGRSIDESRSASSRAASERHVIRSGPVPPGPGGPLLHPARPWLLPFQPGIAAGQLDAARDELAFDTGRSVRARCLLSKSLHTLWLCSAGRG